MNKVVVLLMTFALLVGCKPSLVRNQPARVQSACAQLDSSAEVQLGLVRRMLDQDQPYAGLAHLAALDAKVQASAQARYLEAELLRHTGQTLDAEAHYRGLLESCLAGYGHHGLGLLAAHGDLEKAVTELRQAATLLPTDSRIRNDLGYALLLKHDGMAARREFMTAIELGDRRQRATSNLLLLMLHEGDERGAARLVRQLDLTPSELEAMRRRARDIEAAGMKTPEEEG